MRLLLTHANLVVDGVRTFKDGAILINGDKIEDVFTHTNKIKFDVSQIKKVNVRGLTIIPDFYSESNKRFILDPLNEESLRLSKEAKDKGYKIMIGNTEAYAKDIKDIEYDGFYNLFENMTGFNHLNLGLVNEAFNKLDKYVEINSSNMDTSVFKFCLDNLRKDRIIFIGDIYKSAKLARTLGFNMNDILMMSSLNSHKLYGSSKLNGVLAKGKKANLICLDKDMNIKFRFYKGKLYV